MSEYVSLMNIAEALRQFPSRFLGMFVPLSFFGFIVFMNFLTALFQLFGAMISPFDSILVSSICFLGAAVVFFYPVFVVLFHPISSDSVLSLPPLAQKRRTVLGVVSGLTGLVLLFAFALSHFTIQTSYYLIHYPTRLLILPVGAFAGSTLLVLMDAAGEGETLPLKQAMTQAVQHFRPLLYFGLIVFLISMVAAVPGFVGYYFFVHGSEGEVSRPAMSSLAMLTMPVASLLIAMISFIPAIAVVRRAPFLYAVKHCIDLWACYPLATAQFVLFGGLLLTLVAILQPLFQIPPHGNIVIIAPDLFSFLKVAVGVLVVSSMVVFYRKVLESEEEGP